MNKKISTLIIASLGVSTTLLANAVSYKDFGAKGDGKTDDFKAIIATHKHANKNNLPVKAEAGATYYIGGSQDCAVVETSTNWGDAKFIIDDRNVKKRTSVIFWVKSKLNSYTPESIKSLKIGQTKLDTTLPYNSLVIAKNSAKRQYIRWGANQNAGLDQTDLFIANTSGDIDSTAPIMWEFDQITQVTAYPIDQEPLTLEGGEFITIANNEVGEHSYYKRGIDIRRSNVVVKNLKHSITDELESVFPYFGFINIANSVNVLVEDSVFSGHKTYVNYRKNGTSVSTGTYDITATMSINVTFLNCTQFNSIFDKTYWGIMGTNFCKNLIYDSCKLSRFDAHMGVYNAQIKNSTVGHMGISIIGKGTLLIENSTVSRDPFVSFREDFGSSWDGDLIIKNCIFAPTNNNNNHQRVPRIIDGANSRNHNFGYTCHMPRNITIDGLFIKDSRSPKHNGVFLFGMFNKKHTSENYQGEFPYVVTEKITLKNITSERGKELQLSPNKYMFRDVKIKKNN